MKETRQKFEQKMPSLARRQKYRYNFVALLWWNTSLKFVGTCSFSIKSLGIKPSARADLGVEDFVKWILCNGKL